MNETKLSRAERRALTRIARSPAHLKTGIANRVRVSLRAKGMLGRRAATGDGWARRALLPTWPKL